VAARLDVVGVFGYSDEDGTEAEGYREKVPEDAVAERVARFTALVEELGAQRAEERIGQRVEVLVEEVDDEEGLLLGRALHQGPDVDGITMLRLDQCEGFGIGDLVPATVVGTEGIDLVAEPA
jgi:tRNA A37 methylthiotransferase MiaB